MRFNKKASLEISIQAIVIVVLAMTLLGLGLGFVRNMFKNIGGTTEEVTEQVRQKITDDLITGDKKVSFPKSTILIDKGSSETMIIGVRNKNDIPLNYKMKFSSVQGPDGSGGMRVYAEDELDSWFLSAQPTNGYVLKAADADIRKVQLNIPRSVASGTYVLTFEIDDMDVPVSDPSHIYAQIDFFITVRG